MNDDALVTFPAPADYSRPGTPLCTCRLAPFGGIEVYDPNCEGTDMH